MLTLPEDQKAQLQKPKFQASLLRIGDIATLCQLVCWKFNCEELLIGN